MASLDAVSRNMVEAIGFTRCDTVLATVPLSGRSRKPDRAAAARLAAAHPAGTAAA